MKINIERVMRSNIFFFIGIARKLYNKFGINISPEQLIDALSYIIARERIPIEGNRKIVGKIEAKRIVRKVVGKNIKKHNSTNISDEDIKF